MLQPPVRVAVRDDLAGLLELYRHLHADDPVLPAEMAERIWGDLLSQTNTKVFVVERTDDLVATCTLTIIPSLTRGGRSYAVIENVVTHAAHRNAGLGSAVLLAAVETAWAAGSYKIMLASGSKLESTLRFYEKAGFRRNARTFFEMRRV